MLHLALLILAAILMLLSALRVPSFPSPVIYWGWLGAFFVVLAMLI